VIDPCSITLGDEYRRPIYICICIYTLYVYTIPMLSIGLGSTQTQMTEPDRTEPAQPDHTKPALFKPCHPTHLGVLAPHEPSHPLDCGGVVVRPGHPGDPHRDPAPRATPTPVHASHRATTTATAPPCHDDCDGAVAPPRLRQHHRVTMTATSLPCGLAIPVSPVAIQK
jgi:hypothetical protein